MRGHDVPLLVKEKNVCAALKEGVGSRETGETAADDDDLVGHCG